LCWLLVSPLLSSPLSFAPLWLAAALLWLLVYIFTACLSTQLLM
jgi:hypothetical protein